MANDPLQQAAKQAETVKEAAKDDRIGIRLPAADYIPNIVFNNLKAAPSEILSTLAAAVREGAKDLRNFFLDPMGGGQQVEEPGMPFNLTPQEIYQEKHHDVPSPEIKGTVIEPPKEQWRGSLEAPAPEVSRERDR